MPRERSNEFMRGALVLAAAAFFVKVLSAVYRVPFQNIVGDTGFYIYQQVYPIYGVAAVLATSGFPVLISRLIAEVDNDDKQKVNEILQAAFIVLLIAGLSLFLLLFFGAKGVAGLMGDQQLTPLIKVVSVTFLLLPFFSVWRGYFQGVGNMNPTAISQVGEQSVRVGCILLFSVLLLQTGYSLYETSAGALAGALIGGLAGLSILLFFVLKDKKALRLFIKSSSFQESYRIGKTVLIHGAVISLSSMLLVLFQLLDSFSLYSLLVKTGINADEAKALKGVFDRGQPLLQLGIVAATALSLSLVPLIASTWKRKDRDHRLQEKVFTAFKISAVIGTGAAFGLINLIKPVNIMLFEDAAGSNVIAVLALAIFFSSIIMTSSGILQGFGSVFTPAKYMFIGLICKLIGNYIFIPSLHTMGAALSTVCGLIVITALLVIKLNKIMSMKMIIKQLVIPLTIGVTLMTVTLQLWQLFFIQIGFSDRLWSAFIALSGVGIGAAVYLFVVFRQGLLSKEESSILPFGSRIYHIFHKSE